jgi:hypothetical protein
MARRRIVPLEFLVVEHAAEPESQTVLGEELCDNPIEGTAVLVGARVAVDCLHLRRRRSKRASHALLNVRAEVDVLDVQRAHSGACEAGEQGIERLAIVAKVRQQGPDEGVSLDVPGGERRERFQPPAPQRAPRESGSDDRRWW